ncbi:hypothetical protein R3P38DRAFT_2852086 [Favolaschia claudopus]|uniref:Uncharacterized protein n=1 Tax=Favolaschia claudopus TaxID=2862362 RepID=A0AAW0DQ72_9AGAR
MASTSDQVFPVSDSVNSNSSSSKLTSSDKLSELPVSSPFPTHRSQNARAIRRSLDSLPSFSSGESNHSPRISQALGNLAANRQANISGNETPKQRVSFDSDGLQAREAVSHSRSRAASPLRILQHLSASLHRRSEPFVPINPFELTRAVFSLSSDSKTSTRTFITDTLPRQVYLHLLLRLPSTYFSRVARIFEDAEVSRPDIERMVDAGIGGDTFELYSARESAASLCTTPLPLPDEWTSAVVSPALIRFKHSWEEFITSLIKEWKTLNLVSALLLSAILTIFQIPSAESDPVTRTTALLSLVFALMSLCYGCVYVVRFSTMRSMYRASKFAEEARKTDTFIWWNVWTLLSMPAVFLAWSVIFFIICIMSFVWRTGSALDPEEREPLGPQAILGPRISITVALFLGLLYFALIIGTLRRYGEGSSRSAGGRRGSGDVEAQLGQRGRTVERHNKLPSGKPRRGGASAKRGDVDLEVVSVVGEKDVDAGVLSPPSPSLGAATNLV